MNRDLDGYLRRHALQQWDHLKRLLPEKIRHWLVHESEAPDELGWYAIQRLKDWDDPSVDEVLQELKDIQREKFRQMMGF